MNSNVRIPGVFSRALDYERASLSVAAADPRQGPICMRAGGPLGCSRLHAGGGILSL